MAVVKIELTPQELEEKIARLSESLNNIETIRKSLEDVGQLLTWLLQVMKQKESSENKSSVEAQAVKDGGLFMEKFTKTEVEEFQQLKAILDQWPAAVDPVYICSAGNKSERIERANQILDLLIEESLKNKSFLDFGCGMGDTVSLALSKGAKLAMGYDISSFADPSAHLTNDFNEVKSKGPFDVVLLYDVLDHIDSKDDPVVILKQISSVITPTSNVYIRCHPWCGRHGGHLYTKFNKAYAHLIFSKLEIEEMKYSLDPIRHIIWPCDTYRKFFKGANLDVIREVPIQDTVENFFQKEIIKKRILKIWNKELLKGEDFPTWQLSLSFVDYVLKLH